MVGVIAFLAAGAAYLVADMVDVRRPWLWAIGVWLVVGLVTYELTA
jgi:hypothetical protein